MLGIVLNNIWVGSCSLALKFWLHLHHLGLTTVLVEIETSIFTIFAEYLTNTQRKSKNEFWFYSVSLKMNFHCTHQTDVHWSHLKDEQVSPSWMLTFIQPSILLATQRFSLWHKDWYVHIHNVSFISNHFSSSIRIRTGIGTTIS